MVCLLAPGFMELTIVICAARARDFADSEQKLAGDGDASAAAEAEAALSAMAEDSDKPKLDKVDKRWWDSLKG